MYKNVNEYQIKYTDVDFSKNLRLSSLLSYLEQSAGASADELGFGYNEITPKGLAFILANYSIKLFRPIVLGENLTVSTWPLKPTKLVCLRDFELFCGDEKVGVATSRWCLMDIKNYKIMPTKCLFEDDQRTYNECRSLQVDSWKIEGVCDDDKFVYERVVRYSDYDYYNHVNNTKYADFALDAFSTEFLLDKYISFVQITYSKQCKEGESIAIFKNFDGEFYTVEGRVQGETRFLVKIRFGMKNEL